MAISARIRQQFAESSGISLEEINDSPKPLSLQGVYGRNCESEVNGASSGRGYVKFGESVSASEKDKENLDLLKHW